MEQPRNVGGPMGGRGGQMGGGKANFDMGKRPWF